MSDVVLSIKKPKAPSKPTEPQRVIRQRVKKLLLEENESISLKELLTRIDEMRKNLTIDNLTINDQDISISLDTEYYYESSKSEVAISFVADVPNSKFEKQMSQYEKDMIIFNQELEKYKKEMIIYREKKKKIEAFKKKLEEES